RRSLEWSRNIPALKAFQEVGEEDAQAFAEDLGIQIDPIYESAALGGFDGASPLQMAGAYAAFGNDGDYNQPFSVDKIVYPDGEKWESEGAETTEAMHDYTAYMITDMLKTVITSGTGTGANIPELPVAGKTGSTNIPQDVRMENGISGGLLDFWIVGYTPQYALAVWTGYPSIKDEDGDVQYIVEDGTQNIAKQIFKQLMTDISDLYMDDFKHPDSVNSIDSEQDIEGKEPSPEERKHMENEEEQENENYNEDEEEYNEEEEYDEDEYSEDYENYEEDYEEYQNEYEDEY